MTSIERKRIEQNSVIALWSEYTKQYNLETLKDFISTHNEITTPEERAAGDTWRRAMVLAGDSSERINTIRNMSWGVIESLVLEIEETD